MKKIYQVTTYSLIAIVAVSLSSFAIIKRADAVVPVDNERVSVDASGNWANSGSQSDVGEISNDGRYVAFMSNATNLVAGDTNGVVDVFWRDRVNGITERVNVTPSGSQSTNSATLVAMSYSGRYVVFSSYGPDLLTSAAGTGDVFMRDMQTGVTELVSSNAIGVGGNHPSGEGAVSGDGRFVAFTSYADNLLGGVNPTASGGQQVFLKDMLTGKVRHLSADSNGVAANNWSGQLSMSCGGRVVAFSSAADNLVSGDTNGKLDVFMAEIGWSGTKLTNITKSGNGDSQAPSLSCNGIKIAYQTSSTNFPSGGSAYSYDRLTGVHDLIAQDTAGTVIPIAVRPTLSSDGRYASFLTGESLDPADSNSVLNSPSSDDIYVRDMRSGTTEVVSRNGTDAVGYSAGPVISADGSYVLYQHTDAPFSSYGQLIANDVNSAADLYISKTGF